MYVADDSTSLVLTCTTSTVSYGTNYTIHWENGTESKVSILPILSIVQCFKATNYLNSCERNNQLSKLKWL